MNPSGHGLGLYISRKICMALGGNLSCDSVKGIGSTFTMTMDIKFIKPNDIRQKIIIEADQNFFVEEFLVKIDSN